MIDEYCHVKSDMFYIYDNICGPIQDDESQSISDAINSQIKLKCNCIYECTVESCLCLKYSGGNNYKDKLGIFNFDKEKYLTSYPIYECNSNCTCVEGCGNRIVQKGPACNLVVKACYDSITKINNKGFGLFTSDFKIKGTFICVYAGEVITSSEALVRYDNNRTSGKMNYIFCLKEHSNDKTIETIVDPSIFGNIGRYINHSCEPNSFIVPVRIDSPIPKLAIFCSKDLEPGTEITFDYGSHSLNFPNSFLNESNLKRCLCGQKSCRQWLPYDVNA